MSSSSQNKRSIPNAFDQARNTGTIGGSGQPPTEETTNVEKQKPTSTETQQPTDATTQKATNVEKKKATSTRKQKATSTEIQQSTDTVSQQTTNTITQKATNVDIQKTTNTKDEEKIQQTMKIRKSLSVRVKVYAATHHPETISSVVETALEEYLAKRENQ